jgi:hypothetical protein
MRIFTRSKSKNKNNSKEKSKWIIKTNFFMNLI